MNSPWSKRSSLSQNHAWEELRTLLQLAALPVTGQTHLVADDCCRLELLAQSLHAWLRTLPEELAATLAPEQVGILAQLERQLARTCKEPASPQWTDTAMRQSAGLRRARWLARQALLSFGWMLEIPAGGFPGNFLATNPG